MLWDVCADRLQQAQRSFESRAFQPAIREFNEALNVCPQRDAILISLGQTQFLAGDDAAAERSLLQAINQTAARYALGRIYYQQGRYTEGAAQLEQVVAREPENYRAHDNLALCYDALQHDSDALRHFFRALDLVKDKHREYDWAYADLAEFFLERDAFDKALPLAVEAAERNPNSARNFFLAGQALVKMGQLQNSLKWLRQAVQLDPSHAEAHYQLGQTLRRLGQTEEAKVHLDVFRKLKSEPPPAPQPTVHTIIEPMRVLPTLLFAMTVQAQDARVGSRVCAGCHPEIYRTYMETGMARSSGRAGSAGVAEKLPVGPISDKSSGATYRITRGPDSYRMEFEHPKSGVSGARDLKWFIGSANVGRSYAFAVDGFLFQAPVSYYSSVERWDLSPGYAGKQQIELAKPIEEPCLYCHASGAQAIAKTQNGYLDPPFLEDGVGCERCHGSGEKHAKTQRDIVNPAKLAPARRDSICQQCHLTGAARVPRPGRGVGTFRPGDLLSDHLAVFVRETVGGQAAATDHSEQLAESKCKLASGDKLWCGTCHDPHSTPAASARVAFYRQSCLGCHAVKGCTLGTEARAAAGDDCASCHMPKGRSREGEHVVYTDHRITRRPLARSDDTRDAKLRSFWGGPVEHRDLAIAYASLGRAALPLLEKLRSSDDAPALVQLGQLYDAAGKEDSAEKIYERVLRLDPSNAAAEANLAIYRARKGRISEAMALWKDVFSRNPALSGAGINLAVAQLGAGDRVAAEATVRRLLRFHPDLEAVRQLAAKLR